MAFGRTNIGDNSDSPIHELHMRYLRTEARRGGAVFFYRIEYSVFLTNRILDGRGSHQATSLSVLDAENDPREFERLAGHSAMLAFGRPPRQTTGIERDTSDA
jgi:hypothetical protein